jgi:hypothetical protein
MLANLRVGTVQVDILEYLVYEKSERSMTAEVEAGGVVENKNIRNHFT